MDGQFLGEVKPLYGRWHWPYTFMQPGDYFIVDQALRNGEAVRQHATVRAAQLGIFLSTTVNDPEYPGFTRVTRRPVADSKPVVGTVLGYGKAGEKLGLWYGYNIDMLPFGMIEGGNVVRVDVEQVQEPSVERMIVEFLDHKLGLVFDAHGFTVEKLAKHVMPENWKSKELTLDDIMS